MLKLGIIFLLLGLCKSQSEICDSGFIQCGAECFPMYFDEEFCSICAADSTLRSEKYDGEGAAKNEESRFIGLCSTCGVDHVKGSQKFHESMTELLNYRCKELKPQYDPDIHRNYAHAGALIILIFIKLCYLCRRCCCGSKNDIEAANNNANVVDEENPEECTNHVIVHPENARLV